MLVDLMIEYEYGSDRKFLQSTDVDHFYWQTMSNQQLVIWVRCLATWNDLATRCFVTVALLNSHWVNWVNSIMTIVLGGMVTYHCPDLVEECFIFMHVLQQRLSHGLLDDENIPPLSRTIPGNEGKWCLLFLTFYWLVILYLIITGWPGVAFCIILLTCLTPKMVTRPSMFSGGHQWWSRPPVISIEGIPPAPVESNSDIFGFSCFFWWIMWQKKPSQISVSTHPCFLRYINIIWYTYYIYIYVL